MKDIKYYLVIAAVALVAVAVANRIAALRKLVDPLKTS